MDYETSRALLVTCNHFKQELAVAEHGKLKKSVSSLRAQVLELRKIVGQQSHRILFLEQSLRQTQTQRYDLHRSLVAIRTQTDECLARDIAPHQ